MQIIRTTVRIEKPLKRAAERRAQELEISFQAVLTRALEEYLRKESKKTARELIFQSQNIGFPLDQLSREDIYAD